METPRPLKPRPDLHSVTDAQEADKNCPIFQQITGTDCEHCGNRYIVHCLECNQQLTNCACTMPALADRHIEQIMEDQEREKARPWEKKLWTPGNN